MKQRFACFCEKYSLHHHAKCQLGKDCRVLLRRSACTLIAVCFRLTGLSPQLWQARTIFGIAQLSTLLN